MAVDLTPAERCDYLHMLVEEARTIERRGLMGTLSAEYAEVHADINEQLGLLGV